MTDPGVVRFRCRIAGARLADADTSDSLTLHGTAVEIAAQLLQVGPATQAPSTLPTLLVLISVRCSARAHSVRHRYRLLLQLAVHVNVVVTKVSRVCWRHAHACSLNETARWSVQRCGSIDPSRLNCVKELSLPLPQLLLLHRHVHCPPHPHRLLCLHWLAMQCHNSTCSATYQQRYGMPQLATAQPRASSHVNLCTPPPSL